MPSEILDMGDGAILDMGDSAILSMAEEAGGDPILDMGDDPILDMAGDPILDMGTSIVETDWPASVPFFIAFGGLSRTGPQDAVIRTAMDHGPDKTRRRFTAAPRGYSGTSPFWTKAQLATFETYFETDLMMGALSFSAIDPMDCTVKTFRFVGGYTVVPVGRKFRVSAGLEILP